MVYAKPMSNMTNHPPAQGNRYADGYASIKSSNAQLAKIGGAPGIALPGQSEQTANQVLMLQRQSTANRQYDAKGGTNKRRNKRIQKTKKTKRIRKKHKR
jgi:hypothetical protein